MCVMALIHKIRLISRKQKIPIDFKRLKETYMTYKLSFAPNPTICYYYENETNSKIIERLKDTLMTVLKELIHI